MKFLTSSPGLQEFLEALSFTNYLEHGTLITYNQVLKLLDVRTCLESKTVDVLRSAMQGCH